MHSMSRRTTDPRWAAALLFLLMPAACAQLNNPFKDSAAYSRDEMATPSTTEYAQTRHGQAPMMRRSWTGSDVYYENGTVTHWPIWFEDPFQEKGNDVTDPADRDAPDNRFAWNAADYLHIVYGPSRYLLNLFGLPFSAVLQPPGWVMASDGRISKGLVWYDHDSTYAKPTDEPPDYNDLSRTRYRQHEAVSQPEAATAGENAAPAGGS